MKHMMIGFGLLSDVLASLAKNYKVVMFLLMTGATGFFATSYFSPENRIMRMEKQIALIQEEHDKAQCELGKLKKKSGYIAESHLLYCGDFDDEELEARSVVNWGSEFLAKFNS